MRELGLFMSSFGLVFALVLQHRFVERRSALLAMINAGFIGALNLMAFRLGADASSVEMVAFVMGQPMGTAFSMWLFDRISGATKPTARLVAFR